MNVTELARKLKITTNQLLDILPQIGFDIGRKAIKVDVKVAQKIIKKFKEQPQLLEEIRHKKTDEPAVEAEEVTTEKKDISIPPVITVRDFAAMLNKPVAAVIQELMKNGILANLNEQIDYETASIIAEDFGFQTTQEKTQATDKKEEENIEKLMHDKNSQGQPRPPVVVVMGHVDHGKTQLLDTIRKTNIVGGESGGITQHIGAYQVTAPAKKEAPSQTKSDKKRIPPQARDDLAQRSITFIDTPGHEAFTAMRSRGARVADIAILVIAADDGIKPQTEEAINIINNAKLHFVVAINKIDKPEADVEKVKQQLAQKNLLPEDWGGKIVCVPVSAKTGQGIDDLLESLVLVADMEKDHITANPGQPAIGTIIESNIDKGEGPIATAVIQTGTLHRGDTVKVGQVVGKIKNMKDFLGQEVQTAPPAMPVRILGLKDVPEVGDFLQALPKGASLKKIMKDLQNKQKAYRDKQTWQKVKASENSNKNHNEKTVSIILKTDTLGSQEAIMQSLETLGTEDVKVRIVKKGLGNINDVDVLQAESTGAMIYGFNVNTDMRVTEIAKEKEIPLQVYRIIYDLIDNVQQEVKKRKTVTVERIELGRAKILAIFRTEKKHMIVGVSVTKGKVETGAKAIILRDKQKIGEGTIEKIQQSKEEVESVAAGSECGLQFKGPTIIQENDFLEIYKEEIHT